MGYDPEGGSLTTMVPLPSCRFSEWIAKGCSENCGIRQIWAPSSVLLLNGWVTLGTFFTFIQPLRCFIEFIKYNNIKLASPIWRDIVNIKHLTEGQKNGKYSVSINFFPFYLLLIDERGLLRRFLRSRFKSAEIYLLFKIIWVKKP